MRPDPGFIVGAANGCVREYRGAEYNFLQLQAEVNQFPALVEITRRSPVEVLTITGERPSRKRDGFSSNA